MFRVSEGYTRAGEEKHPSSHILPTTVLHRKFFRDTTDKDTVLGLLFKVIISLCEAISFPNCSPEVRTIQ